VCFGRDGGNLGVGLLQFCGMLHMGEAFFSWRFHFDNFVCVMGECSGMLAVAGIVLAVLYLSYQVTMNNLRKLRVPTQGRLVVITGCDQGFGAMTAKLLYDMGCTVFATCLMDKSVDEYKKQYPGDKRFHAVQMDVANQASVQRAQEEVSSILGKLFSFWHCFESVFGG
jgi:hypothetical protein